MNNKKIIKFKLKTIIFFFCKNFQIYIFIHTKLSDSDFTRFFSYQTEILNLFLMIDYFNLNKILHTFCYIQPLFLLYE